MLRSGREIVLILQCEPTEDCVGQSVLRIDSQRLKCHLASSFHARCKRLLAEVGLTGVTSGQSQPGWSVVGVNLKHPLVKGNDLVESGRSTSVAQLQSFQVQRVGFRRGRVALSRRTQ